jgi:hypothetical protein
MTTESRDKNKEIHLPDNKPEDGKLKVGTIHRKTNTSLANSTV